MSETSEDSAIDVGYKQQWRNTVEYIEDITYRIWESRDIDFIRDTYSENCEVCVLSGCVSGSETVVHGTEATLEMFPDFTLFPEDVLWNGRNPTTDEPSDNNGCSHCNLPGYHSSHLIKTTMTFDPVQGFDNETSVIPMESRGKRGNIWVIGHCIIKDGVIVKEWLVRENEYLFHQLGVDVDRVARQWARKWQKDHLNSSPAKEGKARSHLAWMKSEYERVHDLANTNQIMDLNLDNIFPSSHRVMYNHLCMSILEKYVKVWGRVGMKSREMFSRHLRQLYHPHARLRSPHGNQGAVVGHADIIDTFDAIVIGGGHDVAMVIDWAILKPGDGNRKYSGENWNPTNAWRYPCDSDLEMHQDFITEFKEGCEATERFTIAARWTIVGKQNQVDPPHTLVPVVVMGESYLRCAGFRVVHDIMVYDNVAVKAQLHIQKIREPLFNV